jgi:hypothetical protein
MDTTPTQRAADRDWHMRYCAEHSIHPVTLMPLDGSPAPALTPYQAPGAVVTVEGLAGFVFKDNVYQGPKDAP